MAPTRQTSYRQLELLVEFVEKNRDIAVNNNRRGPLGQLQARQAWEKLARSLNAIGNGAHKTTEEWKRHWHLLKCRTKAKAADVRRSQVGTGGGPNKIKPLSDMEKRIAAVIGKLAVEGIPDVRIPLNLTEENQPTPIEEYLDMEIFEETELERSVSEQQLPENSAAPASPAAEPASCAALESPGVTATGSSSPPAARRSRPTRRDENLPGWAYAIEERRIAVEERLVAEVAGLGATNREILGCLRQLVQLLQQQQQQP